ncbi:MAG: hypothetical protein WA951_05265, partial [Leeuwenhoekiella sp.]
MNLKITKNYIYLVLMVVITTASYGQLTVTNNSDAGPGSLREAVETANASSGEDEIIFDGDYTINLTSGEILITDDLTITGNGAENTIIDGSGNSGRIFNFEIDGGLLGGGSSTIQELTLTGGVSEGTDGGGAISTAVDGGILPYTLNITNATFTDNTSASDSSG